MVGLVVLVRSERAEGPEPPGSHLVGGLARPDDVVIIEGSLDAFATTRLHGILDRWHASEVLVAGVFTDMAEESTARTASGLGFTTIVVEDCVSAVVDEDHRRAIGVGIPSFAEVATLDGLARRYQWDNDVPPDDTR